jgi:TRAP-type C4-dicarboxylate transport system substrate-binding protein
MKTLKLLVALLLLVMGGAVQAQTLKIATIAPDGTTWMNAMRAGADEIETRTEGRVKLKFYPGGIMGSDQSVLKKIRIGQLQGGALTSGSIAEVYRDAQIYSLPFLFRDYDEVDYVRERMDPAIEQGLEEHGFVVVGLSEGGFAYLMSDKPIRSVGDVGNQKVWLPQGDKITAAVYETVGISPVTLPISDVYTGLQTGLIDTIGSTPTAAIAFQWHTRLQNVTDIPLMYIMGMMVIDKRAFSRLSAADQTVVHEVMGNVFAGMDARTRMDNRKAREALATQGIAFVSPSAEELERWGEIARQSIDRLGEQDVYSSAMHETLMRHLATYRAQAPGN